MTVRHALISEILKEVHLGLREVCYHICHHRRHVFPLVLYLPLPPL